MEGNYGVMERPLPYIVRYASPLVPILLDSLKIIILDYPRLFFTIYIVAALPVSVIITSLSVSATPRRLKVYLMRLEWLSRVVPTITEVKNVWETYEDEVRKLEYFRLLHVVPILIFSTVNVIATVTASSLVCNRRNYCPTLSAVYTALKVKWVWVLLAGVVNMFVWIMWGHVLPILAMIVGSRGAVVVMVVEVVAEVYAMAVLGLSLVVSVEEERSGLDLIQVGLSVMKGRRVCGWVLSGMILVGTNTIGRQMVGLRLMDSQDSSTDQDYTYWTVETRVAYMIGLVLLLGWVILWSNVVFTVFYYDWRKRNMNSSEQDLDEGDIEIR